MLPSSSVSADTSISAVMDAIRQGREVHRVVVDPIAIAIEHNACAMIDVDYAGRPLLVDRWSGAG